MTISDAWVDFVAGWCSGAVAVAAIQPVDTILTRLQATAATTSASSSSSTAALALAQSHGVQSLWRGASPMISAVPIQNALLMGGYGVGQQYYENTSNNQGNNTKNYSHKLTAIFVGGLVGGILQSFVMSPVELVKVQQQVAGATVRQAIGSQVILHKQNFVWRGLGATLLRDGIPHGVWFASYEMCKDAMQGYYQSNNNNDPETSADSVVVPLTSGAVAATVAWGVGYPADLIKTRIQAASSTTTSDGIVATARQIVHESGWMGLYRGFGLKLVRSVPSSMIGFTVYEFVKKNLQENF